MGFCTNCGKSLEDGARFCTNCGGAVQITTPSTVLAPSAPVAAASAPAPEPEPSLSSNEIPEPSAQSASGTIARAPETPVPVPYDFTTAPQSSTTSPTFVIVCVVLLVLIVAGIAGTVYLQRKGKAKTAGEPAPTQTSQPSGAASSNAAVSAPSPAASAPNPPTSEPTSAAGATSPANAVPIPAAPPVAESIRTMNLQNYPGATPVAIATLTRDTIVAGFLTRDTPQQVVQFYKIRFPISTTTEAQGKAELSATLPGGERIRIQAQPQGTSTQVMVLQER